MKILPILCLLILNKSIAQFKEIELGTVHWLRDLKEAQLLSKQKNKPVLILFQEVPGCQTCRNYGSQVLSHPLIVEAIESYFIPLCIFNNIKGKDAEVLKLFSEPSWNNPVVRIVDADLKPVVQRLSNNYSSFALVSKINASLIKLGIRIPEYLNLLESELKAYTNGVEHATIGMYCFWTGEKIYGAIPGVVSTTAGFMNGSEVVEITYNPTETNLNELISSGKKNKAADKLFTENPNAVSINLPKEKKGIFTSDPETKYYLYNSDYKYIPMTPLQTARANSLLGSGKSCESILSPGQLLRYENLKKQKDKKVKNQIGRDITEAWYEL